MQRCSFVQRGRWTLGCLLLNFILVNSDSLGANVPLVWRWSNPTPHGNNIIDMAYTNGLWVQVAERGQIYTTEDWQTWIPRRSHTTNALRAVTFFNGHIVATGENGTVLYGHSVSDFQLLSLNTPDWLEGVAASPNLLVAVGDNAAIYASRDGTNWLRQSAPFTNWLRSVAFGTPAGASQFVAVGEAGLIASSTDGTNWQKRASLTTQNLNRVSWNNGQFWAVGDAGTTLISDSGVIWRAENSGATNALNATAGNAASRLVAGDAELRLFEGRSPWSNELDAAKPYPAPAWTYLSALWDGTSYLVAGRTGMLIEGFKTNATSSTIWLPFSDSVREWLWDVKRMPNLYLAVGDRATILTSLDGIQWDQELPPDSATNSIFLGVGGTTNLAVAVGNAGTIIYSREEFQAVTSTNANGTVTTNQVNALGIIWQSVSPNPTANDLQGVTAFGSLLVVTGGSGTILTSPDAATWTKRTAPVSSFLSSVEAYPGGLVAVGDRGVILHSDDSATWTLRPSGITNWIYRVRYLGGKLIAVGQNGTILTSEDGTKWTSQASGTSRWLNDVQLVGSTYLIVGTQGAVLTSPDAIQWTNVGTITQKSLYGAATFNGQFLAVGIEGVILRTQVTPFSTPIRFLDYPRNPAQNLFLFAGQRDQRFTLDRSTNLFEWVPGPPLEITDSSGTLLYLDEGTNAPSHQFFRAAPQP